MHQALTTVAGLSQGHLDAQESEPVQPVPQKLIDAIQPHVSRPVWGLIRLQLFTGMRPGEAMAIRACDLNMTGAVWEYTPQSHKTEHHGKQRRIFVGPKGQEVISDFLTTDLQKYLFSPRDVVSRRYGKRPPGERYTNYSYHHAIQKACEEAFAMPDELRKIPKKTPADVKRERRRLAAEWRAEHCWTPHQLRHNAATLIRREAGVEIARTVLGHSSLAVTEIYAEQDYAAAQAIMGRIG